MGFPIHIDLSWFAIVVLIAWSLADGVFPEYYAQLSTATYWWMGVAGAVGLFVCVLLHELGHAVVARRFGMEMKGITLFIFGGVAEMPDEPSSAKAEFWVAVGGPIVTVVLAALFFLIGLAPMPDAVAGVVGYLALINVVLLAFNAVPAFPLDGGRVLRSALWHFKGSLRRASEISSRIGAGFGMFLILLALFHLLAGNVIGAIWWFVLGLFLRGAAQMSYQQVLVRQYLQGETVKSFMTDQPSTVDANNTVEQLVKDHVYQDHYKMYPVMHDGELIGCVTTRQIKQLPREAWSGTRVEQIAEACAPENTVDPQTDAMDALQTMTNKQVSRMMVVDNGRLVGILSLKDLMGFLSLKLELEEDTAGDLNPEIHASPNNA